MYKRYKIWGLVGGARPAARFVVTGGDADKVLRSARELLMQKKFELKWRAAELQWTSVLARQSSPWRVWRLVRGKGYFGGCLNGLIDFFADGITGLIPGLRTRNGHQVTVLAACDIGPGTVDFVFDFEARLSAEGSFPRPLAAKVLKTLVEDLPRYGLHPGQAQPIDTGKLEPQCPVNFATKIQLDRQARKEAGIGLMRNV